MTRAARRASLLVAFYLLTSAATADAECAWVLWGAYGKGGAAAAGSVASRNYRPMRAFTKQADCNEYANVWNETQRVDGWIEYVCLPDTVDPRGPKGGR